MSLLFRFFVCTLHTLKFSTVYYIRVNCIVQERVKLHAYWDVDEYLFNMFTLTA